MPDDTVSTANSNTQFCRVLNGLNGGVVESWGLPEEGNVTSTTGVRDASAYTQAMGLASLPGCGASVAGVPVVIPGNGGMTTGYLLPNPPG